MLAELFVTFLVIGFVSFGGGYAMIPVIERQVVETHGWMSYEQFADVIAVAGMSPGPIAINSAIFVGYQTAGVAGAVAAAAGMVVPSLTIILLISLFFYKVNQSRIVQSAFYGLRPIITGLIIYAGITFAMRNGVFGAWNWQTAVLIAIFLFGLFALFRLRLHPVYVILLSGLAGAAFFG